MRPWSNLNLQPGFFSRFQSRFLGQNLCLVSSLLFFLNPNTHFPFFMAQLYLSINFCFVLFIFPFGSYCHDTDGTLTTIQQTVGFFEHHLNPWERNMILKKWIVDARPRGETAELLDRLHDSSGPNPSFLTSAFTALTWTHSTSSGK